MNLEEFAAQLRTLMQAEGVSLETLESKAPKGFWSRLSKMTEQPTPDAARLYWTRNRKGLLDLLTCNQGTLDNTDKLDGSDIVDKDDTVGRKELTRILEALETRLTVLIDRKIADALAGRSVTEDTSDNPPLPKKGGKAGKKLAGTKGNLRARIDSKLVELLQKDCDANYRGNMSRCLDAILWRYYGKPLLSFQTSEESDQ